MTSFQPSTIATQLISVDDAQRIVLEEVHPVDVEVVALEDAIGRVIRKDVRATRDVPLTDNSAMDGYAVRAEDVASASAKGPVTLPVAADVPAGAGADAALEAGTAIRIMTGAPIPSGADAVVPVEWTDAGSESVVIRRAPRVGANIRNRGEDMRAGDVVIRAGTMIRPGEIGVLASLQSGLVPVGRRPRVAVIPTGDELVGLDEPVLPGQVVNSNSYALAALARDTGADARICPPARDSLEETVAAIGGALDADIVLTTGGVSVGAYDWVKPALDQLGGETRFWKVAMKPGKPLVFSRVRSSLVFGLPGNPVSCVVSFLLFAAPAIRKMSGMTANLFGATVAATLAAEATSTRERREFLRVRVVSREGGLVAEPAVAQGSGIATSLVAANGLAIVPEGIDYVGEGETVRVLLYAPIKEPEGTT